MKTVFALLVLIALILIGYHSLPFGFFQQDEWLGLARLLQLKGEGLSSVLVNIFSPTGAHYTPLSSALIFLLFQVFHLNYPAYAFTSLILHILASLLFFVMLKSFLGNTRLAYFGMILFAVSAAGFQATAWPIADIGTHGSTIFGFLTIIIFLIFIKKNNNKFFILSLVSLGISLLFKENAIGFFVLLPVLLFLFGSKNLSLKFRYALCILLVGFLYLSFRLINITQTPPTLPVDDSGQLLSNIDSTNLAYNIVSIPIKSFVQSLIPSFQIYDFSYDLTKLFPTTITDEPGSPRYEEFALKRVFEAANYMIFLVLIALYLLALRKADRHLKQVIIFSVFFVPINSLIFAFQPERSGTFITIDSRNLYLVSAGTIIFLVSCLDIAGRNKLIKILLLVYLALNVWWVNQQIDKLVEVGSLRKGILNQIKNQHPDLSDFVIFYTQSDSSFYGLPPTERIMPFQSGFGQTLLVWYNSTENFPKDFFKNRFLWEITEQGFKKSDSRGFGYFRDFEKLGQTIKENNLSTDSVVSISFDSNTNSIDDISEEVQGRLAGYLSEKKEIPQDSFSITSVNNSQDTLLMRDNNRGTFWDSHLPYSHHQFFEVDLSTQIKVAQITIDSYNNKDQNEVGYKLLLSKDKKVWEVVFFSKRYLPGDEGILNLYFRPEVTRYIRVEQIGFHQFASWVIHEINIYEAVD